MPSCLGVHLYVFFRPLTLSLTLTVIICVCASLYLLCQLASVLSCESVCVCVCPAVSLFIFQLFLTPLSLCSESQSLQFLCLLFQMDLLPYQAANEAALFILWLCEWGANHLTPPSVPLDPYVFLGFTSFHAE